MNVTGSFTSEWPKSKTVLCPGKPVFWAHFFHGTKEILSLLISHSKELALETSLQPWGARPELKEMFMIQVVECTVFLPNTVLLFCRNRAEETRSTCASWLARCSPLSLSVSLWKAGPEGKARERQGRGSITRIVDPGCFWELYNEVWCFAGLKFSISMQSQFPIFKTKFKPFLVRNVAACLLPSHLSRVRLLCDPMDCSLSGFSVHGILQARTLKWVAISFSSAWKWKVKVKSLSRVWLLVTPWTDCCPPGSSIHGIFQATVLEWGAIAFSRNVASIL